MTVPLQLGRIVWADVPDANGIRKLRPAVIVSPNEQISTAGSITVVAVTSRLALPLPPDHVLLPWHPQGHPRTGLNRKCAAVCSWLKQILPSDVQAVGGLISGSVLLDILTKVRSSQIAAPPPTTENPESP